VAFAGRVVYVGYAKSEVCYDTTNFVRKELDIIGSRNVSRVFPAVIRMLEKRHQRLWTLLPGYTLSKKQPQLSRTGALHQSSLQRS
jgi:threonine dehydrogenase-like Zn-dependent dehydrogenase